MPRKRLTCKGVRSLLLHRNKFEWEVKKPSFE